MSLLYLWVSLASAGIMGFVTVLDKRLTSYNMPNLPSLYAGMSVCLVAHGTLGLALAGIPTDASMSAIAFAVASGLCWGGALAMMFWGYTMEEASRSSAIIHTFPVFVAFMGVFLLGETLSIGQWAGIMVVVGGAFLVSIWGSRGGIAPRLNWALPILIGASIFTALAIVLGKQALDELPVLLVYSVRNYGMGLVFLCLWKPGAWGDFFMAMRDRQTLFLLFGAEFTLAPLGVWLNVLAINLGPVSLVATATATRPLSVFLFSTLCSTRWVPILDEPLQWRTLSVKFLAVGMVVLGIVMLTLL
ncbi:MAG: DMT family transporter [Chloroflexi bacterium]|nr:DMT family transporter [Chloroflexota bacterium]